LSASVGALCLSAAKPPGAASGQIAFGFLEKSPVIVDQKFYRAARDGDIVDDTRDVARVD
jgi:hypothetical protein